MAGRRYSRYTEEQIAEFRRRDNELAEQTTAVLDDEEKMVEIRAKLAKVAPSVQRLSLRNQVLLLIQAAERGFDLRDIDTYRGWEQQGRKVKRGEKALRIVAPRDTEVPETEATSGDQDGRRTGTQFRMIPVFDVHQTDGLELTSANPNQRSLYDDCTCELCGDDSESALVAAGAIPVIEETPETPVLPGLTSTINQAKEFGVRVERSGSVVRADAVAGIVYVPATLSEQDAAAALAQLLPALTEAMAEENPQPSTAAPQTSTAKPMRAEEREPAVPTDEAPAAQESVESAGNRQDVWTARLPLGGHYGTATVRITTNRELGRVRYEVTGPNVSGAITISPERNPDGHEPIPQRIDVHFGDLLTGGDWYAGERAKPGAPVVNGIPVLGGQTIAPEGVESDRFSTWARRSTGPYSSEALPTRSQERLTAVTRAVVRHWVGREDLDELRLAAARHEAPARMHAELAEVRRLNSEIRRLIEERDEHTRRAADFRALTVLADEDGAEPSTAETSGPATCRTPGCGGGGEDVEGRDGLCGACADTAAVAAERDQVQSEQDERAAAELAAQRALAAQYPAELGPQWRYAAALIELAGHLTSEEERQLKVFQAAADRDAVRAAKRAALAAALDAERDQAYRLAKESPAGFAAVAVMTRDLLGEEHYRILTEPWARVLGRLHPEDSQLSHAT